MPNLSDLFTKIKTDLEKHIPKNTKILIAFSGGADSTLTALILKRYLGHKNCHLVYFNHGLRTDNKLEQAHVEKFAKQEGLKLSCKKLPIKAYAKRYQTSIETAGHHCRKAMLWHLSKLNKTKYLGTGHHKDDHEENRLLRLIKGSVNHMGKLSFSQIDKRQMHHIKALIKIPKKDILTIIKSEQLKSYTDPSNQDIKYERNKLRQQVIPSLKSINPKLLNRLEYIEKINAINHKQIDEDIKPWVKALYLSKHSNNTAIKSPKEGLNKLSDTQLMRLIYLCYEKIKNYHYQNQKKLSAPFPNISEKHLKRLAEYIKKGKSNKISLPKQLHATLNKTYFILTYQKNIKQTDHPIKLATVKGEIKLPHSDQILTWEYGRRNKEIQKTKNKKQHYLCISEREFKELTLKTVTKEDTMQIFGKTKKRNILTHLKKQQINLEKRCSQSILTTKQDTLCILGVEIAESHKVVNLKKNVLSLKLKENKL
eukprot:COSAG01_NODE_1461_length_10242_cov_4.896283_3_plen_482_part_00